MKTNYTKQQIKNYLLYNNFVPDNRTKFKDQYSRGIVTVDVRDNVVGVLIENSEHLSTYITISYKATNPLSELANVIKQNKVQVLGENKFDNAYYL